MDNNQEFLQGYRSGISMLIGSSFTLLCLYWSYKLGQSQNFVPILGVWVTIMSAFLYKNFKQSELKSGDINESNNKRN